MAEALFEDFLTCSVCLETIKEPVTLGCHHSFCRTCLYSSWEQTRNCPLCRRRSSKEILEVNFALRELSLGFSEQQKTKGFKVCPAHPEVPPLFCKDEDRALCPVCEFSQHQRHAVVSVEKAERQLKEQLRSELQPLKEKRERVRSVEKQYQVMTRHSEEQAEQCERHIRALFKQLHLFLMKEEHRAMEALREEQQRQAQTMGPELRRLREQLASVDHTVQEVEQLLKTDTEAFLRTYNHTQSKAETQTSQPDPQPGPGLLLNQAKVLGNLGHRVWRRMKSLVTFSPVILDPNTAEASLHLSEDLTSVRPGDPQLLPVVPERFTNESIVLGSEGFSSGTHQWTVEVGDLPTWDIGVVRESIDRRGEIYADSSYGVWCLWHGHGRYNNGSGEAVRVKRAPQKIVVKLDHDRGELSFYDADHMTLILTHRALFTEELFPYISVGPASGAKTKDIKVF